jgi:hypothetical protein
LSVKSSMRIRKRGAMFLGNDYGTLRTYEALLSKGFENPITWRNLKDRVRRSGIPVSHTFFTNSVLGLRSTVGSKALDKSAWHHMPQFVEFCQEFLRFQVETLAPRLLVVLGPNASASLRAFDVVTSRERNSWVTIGSRRTLVHCTTHPYGDFNFSESRKESNAAVLGAAWDQALSISR